MANIRIIIIVILCQLMRYGAVQCRRWLGMASAAVFVPRPHHDLRNGLEYRGLLCHFTGCLQTTKVGHRLGRDIAHRNDICNR